MIHEINVDFTYLFFCRHNYLYLVLERGFHLSDLDRRIHVELIVAIELRNVHHVSVHHNACVTHRIPPFRTSRR